MIMSHLYSRFGITINVNTGQIFIFDTDKQLLLHTLTLSDVSGLAMYKNCAKAVVTNFVSQSFVTIDLNQDPPVIDGNIPVNVRMIGVGITPDGKFAVGAGFPQDADASMLASANLITDKGVSYSSPVHSIVAVSPNGNGLVLTARINQDVVRPFFISRTGGLSDSGTDISVGKQPANITFTPDGDFAFVANIGQRSSGAPWSISILNTQDPYHVFVANSISGAYVPQSIAVSCHKKRTRIYVLTLETIEVYIFNPCAHPPTLTFIKSAPHGLIIGPAPNAVSISITQIAIDPTGTKLFVSPNSSVSPDSANLHVFSARDLSSLGTVLGVTGPGTVAICGYDPCPYDDDCNCDYDCSW